MSCCKIKFGFLLVALLIFSALATATGSAPPLVNWTAPPTYPPHQDAKIRALGDISSPVPFIAIAPCRQYNSLLATPLLQGVNRTVTLTGAPCNIPVGAVAASVNITVFNITGATGNGVFKVDTVSPPAVAWINYPPTETQRANAGAVALSGGNIVVQVAQGAGQVDFIVDTNGYYADSPANQNNYFRLIDNSTNYAIYGKNFSTTCAGPCGVRGDTSSTNSSGGYGVAGYALGTTGSNVGVYGESDSLAVGSAGVRGYDGSGLPANAFAFGPAGVVGLSSATIAVMGLTQVGATTGSEFIRSHTTAGFPIVAQASLAWAIGEAALFSGNVSIVANSPSGAPGNLSVAGMLSKGGGTFKIDHPLDPENKYLQHSFVESPDMMNVYNGNVVLDSAGEAVIELPSYFEALNRDYRYQLTSIGRFSPVYIAEEIHGNRFRIAGGRVGARVSWQVTGIRQDAFANAHRVQVELDKEPEARGLYLHPAEIGQPAEKNLADAVRKVQRQREREAAEKTR